MGTFIECGLVSISRNNIVLIFIGAVPLLEFWYECRHNLFYCASQILLFFPFFFFAHWKQDPPPATWVLCHFIGILGYRGLNSNLQYLWTMPILVMFQIDGNNLSELGFYELISDLDVYAVIRPLQGEYVSKWWNVSGRKKGNVVKQKCSTSIPNEKFHA